MEKNQNSNKKASEKGRTTPSAKGDSTRSQNLKQGSTSAKRSEEDSEDDFSRRNSDRPN